MKRVTWLVAVTSFAVFGGGAYLAGANGVGQQYLNNILGKAADAEPLPPVGAGAIIYYRDPDGKAQYSHGPRKTSDGRDFIAVRQSADISFDASGVVAPTSAAAAQNPKVGATSEPERKVLYYRNPMGLPDTSKEPKKDSMGMDYIPVYEGEQAETSTVKVSLGKLQRTGVKTALAEMMPISRKVRVPGVVGWDERLVSVVSMRTDSFIDAVANVTTGDRIAKGQKLFSFYSQEIATAGAEYAAGRGGRGTAAGSALRLKNLGVPQEAIEQIAAQGQVPASIDYASPREGIVLERMATTGMMAKPGDQLFRVADPSVVWVVAEVPEYDIGSVKIGSPVTVTVRSLPGQKFSGNVSLIYPEVEQQTRTTKIRIELPNPQGKLFANMYADVDIEAGAPSPVLSVDSSAVIDTGDRQVVFVDKGEGRFEPRDVTLGVRGDERSQITKGIAPGDRVVIAANFLLDAESNLNSALSAMTPQEAKP
ncbi:efflux RND transporter periplasmic adaptor subunit [Rhizobium sp. BG4]|uniref:efflux RND transporter periplasmic adaptor subunit n=1 Tax=Rhizobium sp. BG4 TaxID=2613770 RepID=UPI00193D0471|nr:efflux RND transporter periplasmic adaptor subunit [Rhizobium sp. BG4]